jgi:hypothetical protein
MIVDADNDSELVEIFNGLVVKSLKSNFGEDAIIEIVTCRISVPVRVHHNYMPMINMDKGIIKKSWSDDYLFVERKASPLNQQKYLFNFE